MKKYGKFEKKPKMSSTLLRTYMTSLLSLVLCMVMFFGTSFAWFTSEVNNAGNEIYIGTLDVELEKKTGETKWDSLSAVDANGKNTTKLFNENIRWEPGYTMLETVRVTNEGDLAFKYQLNFTDGKLAEEGEERLAEVAGNFDVWVYDHNKNGQAPDPASYADITAENSKWANAGKLDELLDGEVVLKGEMEEQDVFDNATGKTKETSHTYTIAVHMSEDATGEGLMKQKISLNVKLVAYQMAAETDGFKNSKYDSTIAAVSNVADLKSALSKGGNILLISDFDIEKAEDFVTIKSDTLDGDGHAIRYTAATGEKNSAGVVTAAGGVVRNLTINGGTAADAISSTGLTADLYVSKCTLSGARAFNLTGTADSNHTINFNATVFESTVSYENKIGAANFEDCTFKSVLKPYAKTELVGCTFDGEKLYVNGLEAGETITLTNCSYNGKVIENLTITKTSSGYTLSDNDQFKIDNEVLKWKG